MHEILSALGEINRLKIIKCLVSGQMHVGVLATHVKLPMVNVSHHLGLLSTVGVVISERRGRYVHYQLNPEICSSNPDGLIISLPHKTGHVLIRGG